MIAAWMLYCAAIAVLFVVVGEALERALHLAGRATRSAWVVAPAGSYVVPAAAWLRPSAFGALPIPLVQPVVGGLQATAGPSDPPPAGGAPLAPVRSFSLGDLDVALAWAWGLSAAALLFSFGAAALRLAASRRDWRDATVDGRAVLVSDNVGPAVAGLWRPRVVLPEWALLLGDHERRLMLAHEDEHIRARDPSLLAAAAALLLLAPWNLMLWWQVRRLRLAVEMDCDARVLAHDGDAPAYGELLLRVVQRRARLPLGAPALGEPVSFLGRRIRRMATTLPRWRWLAAIAATSVAVAAVIAACEAPRPMASEAPDPQYARAGRAEHEAAEVDSARAIAIALRNLCGVPAVDTTCLVRSYEYTSGHHVVVLDRRPPAGNDRVAVQVSGVVGNVYLKANELPFAQRAAGPIAPDGGKRLATRSGLAGGYFVPDGAYLKVLAHEYHPEMFGGHPAPNSAIALVLASQGGLLGHASGIRKASDHDVDAVVTRLLPAFAGNRATSLGSVDLGPSGGPIVYWKVLNRYFRMLNRVEGAAEAPSQSTEEERPVFLSGPPLQYPNLLRQAGIQGRVLVRAIIDTTGRAEPASVRVVESPHPGFDQAARDFVLHARFSHGRLHGRAVRTLIEFPVTFQTTR